MSSLVAIFHMGIMTSWDVVSLAFQAAAFYENISPATWLYVSPIQGSGHMLSPTLIMQGKYFPLRGVLLALSAIFKIDTVFEG